MTITGKDGRKYAEKAAKAHTNLNTYYAVIALMEGGLLYDGRHKASERIIKICKEAASKELAIYDAAMEKVKP